MADHIACKFYADCDYRNDIGACPDRCVQYRHKDDVRVVRCKDCIHMKNQFHARFCEVWCMYNGMGDDGFCNYGERRCDNEVD